jgi:hypothetical protein
MRAKKVPHTIMSLFGIAAFADGFGTSIVLPKKRNNDRCLLDIPTSHITLSLAGRDAVLAKPLRPAEASASFITGLFSVPAPSIRSNAIRRGF